MSLRPGVEPPRRLLGLFVAVIVTIAAALGWLGWRVAMRFKGVVEIYRRPTLSQLGHYVNLGGIPQAGRPGIQDKISRARQPAAQ